MTLEKDLVGDLIPKISGIIENSYSSKGKETDFFFINAISGVRNLHYTSNITMSAQHHQERIEEGQANGTIPTSVLYPGSRLTQAFQDIGFNTIENNTTPRSGWGYTTEAQPDLDSLPLVEEDFINTRRAA